MAFRKFGGLNYSASNNIVRNNLANSDNLTISKKLGLLNSKIPVESHLDMSGNSIMNVGSISFFADGSVQTTAYDTTGGAPGNFTTGTFSGLLTANGGIQCTDASFSGPVNVNGGIQGPNASFTGISGTNANFTTGNFSGISGNNANFNTLTCVTETITGTLGVSGQISAGGGISGTTGYFNNLVVAGGTAYFVNIPLCLETGIGGYTPGSSGQLTTKAYVDSKITSVSTIQVSNSTSGIYYPVLTSAIGPGQTLYGATSQLYMNTNTGLLNVYGVTATTGFFGGLLRGSGGVTATTGFFSGLLSGSGGVTATTGFFKNMLSADGGFTGSTGFFGGLLSANGGFTGSTGFFGGLLSANGGFTGSTGFFGGLLSANGGFTGSTGFFGGLLSANGGFTGSTGFFGGLLSANGGFTGSTGFFKNMLSADGGITGATAFFSNTLSAAGGFTGSTGFFGGLLSANGGFTGSTGFFSRLLSANGGITGATAYFSNTVSAASGLTASTGFFSGALSAAAGITATTGYFSGLITANSGIQLSNAPTTIKYDTNDPAVINGVAAFNNLNITNDTNGLINLLTGYSLASIIGSTSSNKGLGVGYNVSANGETDLINYTNAAAPAGGFSFYVTGANLPAYRIANINTTGITSSGGYFSGLLRAESGITASNAFFSGVLSAAAGITATTAYFSNTLSAAAGITATTAYFSNTLSANGGFTASTGYFGGLLRAAGGITGATAYFSNTLTAAGGFTGSAGYFGGLLRAASGITANTGYFENLLTANSGISLPSTIGTGTIGTSGQHIIIYPSNSGGVFLNNANGTSDFVSSGNTSSFTGLSIGWNGSNSQGGPSPIYGTTDLTNYYSTGNGGFNFWSGGSDSSFSQMKNIGYLPPTQPTNAGDSSISIPTNEWVQRAIAAGSSTTASKINIMASGATSTICYIPFSPTGTVGPNNLLIDEFATAPSLTYQPSTNTLNVPGNIVCGGTGTFQKISINSASTITQIGNTLSFGLTSPGDVNFLTQSGYAVPVPGATTSAGVGFGWNATNSGGESVLINYQATGSTGGFDFYQVNTLTSGHIIASIKSTGIIAPSFNATSDYRIKENPVPIADTVDALRPLQYFNKATNKKDFGFLAHEVQELFPFLVQGDKDGDSNQSLNYMGLIALLVKEVQDLKQKINNIV